MYGSKYKKDSGAVIKGIYCIVVNKCIVYVGKSRNVEQRIQAHWNMIYSNVVQENKYNLLHQCLRQRVRVDFYLIEEVEEKELDEKEQFWIRNLKPILNSMYNEKMGMIVNSQYFFEKIYEDQIWLEGIKILHVERCNGVRKYSKKE